MLSQTGLASVVISNLVSNDGGSLPLSPNQAYAAGFTVTQPFSFTDATVRLNFSSRASGVAVDIFSDAGGHPGSLLLTLTMTTFRIDGIPLNYTFTGGSSLTLQTGSTYWLVVVNPTFSIVSWAANNPPLTPTGPGATTTPWFQVSNPFPMPFIPFTVAGAPAYPAFAINGTLIPEPSTVALCLATLGAFALGRARRRCWNDQER